LIDSINGSIALLAPLCNISFYFLGTDNTQQGKVLAAVVIGEFVFLYLIFDSILYTKQAGLMHRLHKKCRGDKRGRLLLGLLKI
jgi:hypothetical protein